MKYKLNKEQAEAVKNIDGPMLIIAGAGTGKTFTLIERIKYMLEKGIDPRSILLMTFTNKAAEEMVDRIEAGVGVAGGEITATTYHSFCNMFLRKYSHLAGFDNNFTIQDSSSNTDAISIVVAGNKKALEDNDFPSSRVLAEVFSYVMIKDIDIMNKREYQVGVYSAIKEFASLEGKIRDEQLPVVNKLFFEYMSYKRSKNLMDYDDLLFYTNYILDKNEKLRNDISAKYKYKMVDEFQDSNKPQLKLVKNLTADGNENIAVVGDDQQSIYGFRGADFKNIMDFPKMYEDTKIVILKENFRSDQFILDMANLVIESAEEKYDKDLVGVKGDGDMPELIKVKDSYKEADLIVDMIEDYMAAGVPASEIAIIQRYSSSSSLLEAELNKRGIEYDFRGGKKLFDLEIIKNIFAWLKVLENPQDSISWFRVLRLYPGIGPHYARMYSDKISSAGVSVLIDDKKKNSPKYMGRFGEIYFYYNVLLRMNLMERLKFLLGSETDKKGLIVTPYKKHYEIEIASPNIVEIKTGKEFELRNHKMKLIDTYKMNSLGIIQIPRLKEGEYVIKPKGEDLLFSLVILEEGRPFLEGGYFVRTQRRTILNSNRSRDSKFDSLGAVLGDALKARSLYGIAEKMSSTKEFLDSLTLDRPDLTEEDKIVITTVHSSKGLEFEVVFVLSAVDGVFPRDYEDIEEERRCFYVAVTRAKRKLHVLAPERALIFGRIKNVDPSIFLTEHSVMREAYETINNVGYSSGFDDFFW